MRRSRGSILKMGMRPEFGRMGPPAAYGRLRGQIPG
jgi:hypothetical protein